MTNLPTSPVTDPERRTPPFGHIDPLVMALRLDGVVVTLGEARLLGDLEKPAAAKELIREAQARLQEQSRALRQEHDAAEQATRLAPARRTTVKPSTAHVEGLACDFDRALTLLRSGDAEGAGLALALATHQLRNLGAALGPVTR